MTLHVKLGISAFITVCVGSRWRGIKGLAVRHMGLWVKASLVDDVCKQRTHATDCGEVGCNFDMGMQLQCKVKDSDT